MDREKLAQQYFLEGYNCSQSLVLSFKDLVNIDEKILLSIASSFGGGMGRLRETCGAVTGMLIIAGLLYGYYTPETGKIKENHYKKVQDLALSFEKEYKSIVCRELLNINIKHDSYIPSIRNDSFYKNRPCLKYIQGAVKILEKYIENNNLSNWKK